MPKFGKITRPKKETTNALNEARTQTFDGLYQSLETKEGDKSIYSLEDRNYNYYCGIQEYEVKETLKNMSNGKKVRPANIPVRLWESFGERDNK
ncbi:hypothetical protein MTR_8g075620 [Medicago truncatula]|uniref:Uncharacterized protein n=1 Tax=Medicago truncatula TaxID=3880 RepID=G7LC31_MEDTR|nr:hypothetical protein MTR_8g075620 [Medicago truncatula]